MISKEEFINVLGDDIGSLCDKLDMLVIISVFLIGTWIMYDAFIFCNMCRINIENKGENNIIIFPGTRR